MDKFRYFLKRNWLNVGLFIAGFCISEYELYPKSFDQAKSVTTEKYDNFIGWFE